MSASSGNNSNNKSKPGDVKPGASFNVLNINDLYRGKSLEPKPTGGVARHGMQTIGKIKNLTRIPAPDNSPATTGQVKEKTEKSVDSSLGVESSNNSSSQGWSKAETSSAIAPSDSPLNRTQATSDFYPRAQSSGPSNQSSSLNRSATAPVTVSATPSPGAPWSGDAPSGAVPRYLNPEFPDLDSAISDPKQALLKTTSSAGPQLRPQVPPGANWNQGMANAGNQHQSGGNGANGQYGGQHQRSSSGDPRNYPPSMGRPDQDINARSSVRNTELKNVGVLSPSKIEELDKILDQASLGPDWSATQDFDYNQTLEFDHDDDFLKKKKEKEAADLELVNSDRPKVEGPHRPLFDPNDSKSHHVSSTSSSSSVRNQDFAPRTYSSDDRSNKNVMKPVSSSHPVDNRPDPYNRSFNKTVQIPPRFQKQFQEQQQQQQRQAAPNITRNQNEGSKSYNSYGAPQASHFDANPRGSSHDRRPVHDGPRDMHVLHKNERDSKKTDTVIVKPPPIGSWADAMESPAVESPKVEQTEPVVKKEEKVSPIKPAPPAEAPKSEAWPRSGKRAEPTRAKPVVQSESIKEPKILTPPVTVKSAHEEVKKVEKPDMSSTIKPVPDKAPVPVVKYGPPPSNPAFGNAPRPAKDAGDARRHQDTKTMEPKRQQPQNLAFNNRQQQPQTSNDRRVQYVDNREPNRYRNDDRHRDYRDNRNDDRHRDYRDNRRQDNYSGDRKHEEQAPRFRKDQRLVQEEKRHTKTEKSLKPVEPDTGTEIWETASENSHKDDPKSEERDRHSHPRDTRKRDDRHVNRDRRDSHRESDMKWKPEPRGDNRDRETRSYGRDPKSYERDNNTQRPQRKYSDSRGDHRDNQRRDDNHQRRDDKDRRGSKDSNSSSRTETSTNDVSVTTNQLSKMSLKDKTGHHQYEGEVSDDGFQRVDRSKKRVKSEPAKPADLDSHLKKQSKFAPRISKSRHDPVSNSKLDKLSEEAFCSKGADNENDISGTSAWVKPLSQGPSTSGFESQRFDARNRNVRAVGKLGSIEHQDSGVDICSDQPTSTTSSQRSSPGDHAKRAGLTTSTRAVTQTTSVTIPRTLTENVAEESAAPVGTIVFENRNLKAENEALNIKKRDALLLQQQQQQQQQAIMSENRRAITGSSSSHEPKVQNDGRFEIGHFSVTRDQVKEVKEEPVQNATQDLDQKIASVKKVWEEPSPSIEPHDARSNASAVFPDSSQTQSPPRPVMNPSLAPGYKMQAKQVAVAYPMTSSANHMTPSPPVMQPSQISSPPLDPLRQSMMGYPSHAQTPPAHMYNAQAANFYQQFGNMYQFTGQQNTMNAFSHVLNQGFPNMMAQQTGQYPNDYNIRTQFQMQQMKEGQMQQQQQNSMSNQMHQNNSYFANPNHSFYQQPMQQQQGQYGMTSHQANQSYRPQQPMLPRSGTVDTTNGSSNVLRSNNQVAPGNNMYNTQAEVFQKLLLQHQQQAMAASQAATAIVGRGQGNKIPSGPNQVAPVYNSQNFQQQQQRPMQMHTPMASMQRPLGPQSAGLPMQATHTMGMMQQQQQQMSYPQPIQRPSPAGPSSSMTAQYLNKGSSNHKSLPKGVVPGQNLSSQDREKMREDALRATSAFFASTRDPTSGVDGSGSEQPSSLE